MPLRELIKTPFDTGVYVEIPDWLLPVYRLKLLQKKGFIKQLDFVCSRVFRSANHTRIEHLLGVLNITRQLIESIEKKGFVFSEIEKRTIEVAAIIHDITHPPFSHCLEYILYNYEGKRHDDKLIDYLKENEGFFKGVKGIDYDLLLSILKRESTLSPILFDIVGADKLDYVYRDALSTGKSIPSRLTDIIGSAYFDGDRYGIEMFALDGVITHIHNWLILHTDVYLYETSNTTKGLLRRAVYELINQASDQESFINGLWILDDDELLGLIKGNEVTVELHDRIKYGQNPETFLSFKLTGNGVHECNNYYKTIIELPKDELIKLVDYFEDIHNLIKTEEIIESMLGLKKYSITISEMPHIDRLKPKDALIYLGNNQWSTALKLKKSRVNNFTEDLENCYALRICVAMEYLPLSEEQINKVLNYLTSLI